MNIKKSKMNVMLMLGYAYISIPFLLFVIGWTKMVFWLPAVALVLYCYYKACQDGDGIGYLNIEKDQIGKLILIVLSILFWVYLSGIGKYVFQNTDHATRNTIFEVLVNYDWPIINMDIISEQMPNTSITSLIYYIGFWIPAVAVGKLFGMEAGYFAQYVWAVLGVALVYYFICVLQKKLAVWPLYVMIFFSGLDIIGNYLTGVDVRTMSNTLHLEWWNVPYQFSSMTSQLFWVFNQAIPAWLCTILLLVQKNKKSVVFILACSLLTNTFPFVGIATLAIYLVLFRRLDAETKEHPEGVLLRMKRYVFAVWNSVFTVQNVLGGGIIGITSFLYLSANYISANAVQGSIRGPQWNDHLLKWILFFTLEVGIYFIIMYKYQKHNGLYYFSIMTLIGISLLRIGYSNDFCMRASIPALFIVMLMVMETLRATWEKKDYGVFIALLCVVLIGAVTPAHEITRTTVETVSRLNEGIDIVDEQQEPTAKELLNSPNFAGDIEDNFFFRYIAK